MEGTPPQSTKQEAKGISLLSPPHGREKEAEGTPPPPCRKHEAEKTPSAENRKWKRPPMQKIGSGKDTPPQQCKGQEGGGPVQKTGSREDPQEEEVGGTAVQGTGSVRGGTVQQDRKWEGAQCKRTESWGGPPYRRQPENS